MCKGRALSQAFVQALQESRNLPDAIFEDFRDENVTKIFRPKSNSRLQHKMYLKYQRKCSGLVSKNVII